MSTNLPKVDNSVIIYDGKVLIRLEIDGLRSTFHKIPLLLSGGFQGQNGQNGQNGGNGFGGQGGPGGQGGAGEFCSIKLFMGKSSVMFVVKPLHSFGTCGICGKSPYP